MTTSKRRPLAPHRGSEPSDRATSRKRDRLVLIVDDNVDTRQLYARYFAIHGFRVETSADGVQALAMAQTYQPDVVVMDLSLPHLDGWETTRRLTMDPRTAHIPIIACTGNVLGASAARALDAGCVSYLVKPCLPEELLAEVRRVLRRRAASRSAARAERAGSSQDQPPLAPPPS